MLKCNLSALNSKAYHMPHMIPSIMWFKWFELEIENRSEVSILICSNLPDHHNSCRFTPFFILYRIYIRIGLVTVRNKFDIWIQVCMWRLISANTLKFKVWTASLLRMHEINRVNLIMLYFVTLSISYISMLHHLLLK